MWHHVSTRNVSRPIVHCCFAHIRATLRVDITSCVEPHYEDKKEECYKVAKYMREKLKNAATSVETVTKKALKNVKY